MQQSSCLVSRLERYLTLTEDEKDFIAYMEREERPVSRRDQILEPGAETNELYVLKFGWALVKSPLVNGRSGIVRVYLPGEVIGLAEIARTTASTGLVMRTDGMICPFPRRAVSEMFARTPRIAALLMSLNGLEQIALRERIVTISRRDGLSRVAHFLIEMQDQLSVANTSIGNRINVPLTQQEIGDILGLTSIWVNKQMKRLIEIGWISVEGHDIRILNRDAMVHHVGYKSWRDKIDTSWYPKVE